MIRYLLLVLACCLLVACGGTDSASDREWNLVTKPNFGSATELTRTVQDTCVRIKATSRVVRMSDWLRMQPQPEVETKSIARCSQSQ